MTSVSTSSSTLPATSLESSYSRDNSALAAHGRRGRRRRRVALSDDDSQSPASISTVTMSATATVARHPAVNDRSRRSSTTIRDRWESSTADEPPSTESSHDTDSLSLPPGGEPLDRDAFNERLQFARDNPDALSNILVDANLRGLTWDGIVLRSNDELCGSDLRHGDLSGLRVSVDRRLWPLACAWGVVQAVVGACLPGGRYHWRLTTQAAERSRTVGPHLWHMYLGEAQLHDLIVALRRAGLTPVLTGAILISEVLAGADLCGVVLDTARFDHADLTGADFRGAVLRDSGFRGAILVDANLTGADLRGADLRGADLTGADLTGAALDNVHIGRL